jgi:glycine betaine/proline transport system ATP-binding protein
VLTLRWIMRKPEGDEASDGPALDVRTTVRDAVPVIAANEKPVRAVEDGRVVGVVDRMMVLETIAARS